MTKEQLSRVTLENWDKTLLKALKIATKVLSKAGGSGGSAGDSEERDGGRT